MKPHHQIPNEIIRYGSQCVTPSIQQMATQKLAELAAIRAIQGKAILMHANDTRHITNSIIKL